MGHYGWVAAAVLAIGAYLASRHKGGPKVGGSFMAGYGPAGQYIDALSVPGTDNGRFYTPNQQDSQMRAAVDATSKTFSSVLASLGGRSPGFRFGLCAHNHPIMTASQNQFQTAVANNEAAMRKAMQAYAGSSTAATNLAAATTSYYNAQVQLLAGVSQVKQAIGDMFQSTYRNIATTGLNNQDKY